jgi:hypothetical protein
MTEMDLCSYPRNQSVKGTERQNYLGGLMAWESKDLSKQIQFK